MASHRDPPLGDTFVTRRLSSPFVALVLLGACLGACQAPPTSLEDPFLGIVACLDVPALEEQACLDDFIAEYALATGLDTRGLLARMEDARASSLYVNSACHPIAHAIGRWTYLELGQVGDSFNACDQSCHSGCFHGVMERVFDAEGAGGHITVDELRARAPTICTADNFEDATPAEIFQCLHGLGHAILYSVDYELDLALVVCDTLGDFTEQQICATGVVMENITAFDKEKRDIDPERPLYPCDSIAESYRGTCFRMQTSLMLEYGLSLMAIEEQCLHADSYAFDCFASLGRDFSVYFLRGDFQDAILACQEYSSGYEDACISGMVVALIDNSWDARYAYPYCTLIDAQYRPACFSASNYYLSSMYALSNDQIAAQCAQYAGDDAATCLDNLPR